MIDIPYHSKRDDNLRKFRCHEIGQAPCIICGKPVDMSKPHYAVHVHGGGGILVTEQEAASMDSASDLGGYPVGPSCYKKHPELKGYATPSILNL